MLDMPLTDIPGPEICRRVRAASADIVVLGITSYSLDHYRQLAIDAGAQGLIAKSVTPKELAEAMRNVLVRPFPGFPTTEQAHGSIVSASARRSRTLSKREREVLGLYADNYSTAEIAERLGIADYGVRGGAAREGQARRRHSVEGRARVSCIVLSRIRLEHRASVYGDRPSRGYRSKPLPCRSGMLMTSCVSCSARMTMERNDCASASSSSPASRS